MGRRSFSSSFLLSFLPSFLIVCGVLAATAVQASATPRESCACGPEENVLPAPGASGVPRNAKIWTSGYWTESADLASGDSRRELRPTAGPSLGSRSSLLYDPGTLDAGRMYTFDDHHAAQFTWFTTSAELATRPPAAPRLRSLALSVADHAGMGGSTTGLALDAELDPEVALLHFTFTTEGGFQMSVMTTRDGWRWLGRPACSSELLAMRPGANVTVELRAVDLAGNESEPVTRVVVVQLVPDTEPACSTSRSHCGMGAMGLLAFYLFGGLVLFLVLAIAGVSYLVRRDERDAESGTPISLLVAEQLARSTKHWAAVRAILGAAAAPALLGADESWSLATVGGIVAVIVAGRGLLRIVAARRVLAFVEWGNVQVTAEVVGERLLIKGPTHGMGLKISPRALVRALRHAVPASIARRS
ncbi:MAG TPA: hypothetical protein VH165_11415 [Kofleriaceae bacterium]|nr:hypothetical protein [Kofleriaceae bacterium]